MNIYEYISLVIWQLIGTGVLNGHKRGWPLHMDLTAELTKATLEKDGIGCCLNREGTRKMHKIS